MLSDYIVTLSVLLIFSIVLKMGAIPFHFWVPNVVPMLNKPYVLRDPDVAEGCPYLLDCFCSFGERYIKGAQCLGGLSHHVKSIKTYFCCDFFWNGADRLNLQVVRVLTCLVCFNVFSNPNTCYQVYAS